MQVRSSWSGLVVSMMMLGCGGDDSGSPATGANNDAGSTHADAGTSGGGNDAGSNASKDSGSDISVVGDVDVCKLIQMQHLAAIYKMTPIVKSGFDECDFSPVAWPDGQDEDITTATYRADDDAGGNLSLWTLLGPQSGDGTGVDYHEVSGVGDKAYWFDLLGEAPPSLIARKGKSVCLVQTATQDDAAQYNLTFTGTPPVIQISDADATTFAALLAPICNDIFANAK